ncbi:hypothetical protein PAMP_023615 [Pampus punctatissimus]
MEVRLVEHQESEKQYAYAVVRMTNWEFQYVSIVFFSHGTIEKHLDLGKKMITTFRFNSQEKDKICEMLVIKWKEMINISAMTAIRELITKDFNDFAVNYFGDLKDMSCPNSDYFRYYQKFKEITFKLKHKNLLDFDDLYTSQLHSKKIINYARNNLIKLAKSSHGTEEQHLDLGKKKIATFTYNSQEKDKICVMLVIKWEEMINNEIIFCDFIDRFNSHLMTQFKAYIKPKSFERAISSDEGFDSVSGDEWWVPFIKAHLAKKETEKQYAFAIVKMRNVTFLNFNNVYPDFNKKDKKSILPSAKFTKHSEEILIEQIDAFLKSNGAEVHKIFIYTVNSPCLKRENRNIVPCMIQIINRANYWEDEYGISTDVGFSNSWGPGGKNYFGDLKDMSCPNSDYFRYYQKFKEITFKLKHKNLLDFDDLYTSQLHSKKIINYARNNLIKLAKSSHGTEEQHLDLGKKKIATFTFNSQEQDKICEMLVIKWKEMININAMTAIRELITKDFNDFAVKRFATEIRRPFRLYQIPRNMCREE